MNELSNSSLTRRFASRGMTCISNPIIILHHHHQHIGRGDDRLNPSIDIMRDRQIEKLFHRRHHGIHENCHESSHRPMKSSTRLTGVSLHLLCRLAILILSSSLAAASEVKNSRLLARRLDTVIFVDPTGNLTNASVLPNVNYSSFFDDDSITHKNKPVSKSIPLPPFTITLQLGSSNVTSYDDLSTDLNQSLSNYLLNQVANRTIDSSATVTSLSLDIHRAIRRYLRNPTFRIIVQSSSLTFEGNGNISVTNPTNVFQTDAALTQTINSAVESSLSDVTALLAYITSHASTASLKNIIGVSTSVNGQVYSPPVVNPLVDNTNKHGGVSVKRILCQFFGYALIAIAGVSAFGWMYLFYLRYEAQKEDLAFQKASRAQKKDTTNTKTFANLPSCEAPISKRICSNNPLQVSRNTTHEELSDDSLRDDSLFGDPDDDDSFAMKLQKAIILDRSSGHVLAVKPEKANLNASKQSDPMMKPFVIPTLKPPPRQGTNRMMYALSKTGKYHHEGDIPDPVDLELPRCDSTSSSSAEYEETPISYFQISTQSTSQHVKLIRDSPDLGLSEGPALDFAFKPRLSHSVDRVIPKDEYDAAVNAAAVQIKQVSSGTPKTVNKKSNDFVVHPQPALDEKRNVRDYLVAKLSSLINKLDPVDPAENKGMIMHPEEEKQFNMNDDCMSDNDTGTGTVSTSGPSHGDDANVRLGIHPIASKDNTFRPPSSISMKRILQDISKPDHAPIPPTVRPGASPPSASNNSEETFNVKAKTNLAASGKSLKQKIAARQIDSKDMQPSQIDSSTSSVLASTVTSALHTQNMDTVASAEPSSTLRDPKERSIKKAIDTKSNVSVPYAGLKATNSSSQIFDKGPQRTGVAVSTVDETISNPARKNLWKQNKDTALKTNPPQSIPNKFDTNVNVDPIESMIDHSANISPSALRYGTSKPIHTQTINREQHSPVIKPKRLDKADSTKVFSEATKSNMNTDSRFSSTSPVGKSPKQRPSEVSLNAILDVVSPSNINQQSGIRPSAVKAAAESLKRPQSRFKDPQSWMSTDMDPTEKPVTNIITPPPHTPPRDLTRTTTTTRPKSPVYAATPPQVVPPVGARVNAAQVNLRGSATKLIEKFEKKNNLQYVL